MFGEHCRSIHIPKRLGSKIDGWTSWKNGKSLHDRVSEKYLSSSRYPYGKKFFHFQERNMYLGRTTHWILFTYPLILHFLHIFNMFSSSSFVFHTFFKVSESLSSTSCLTTFERKIHFLLHSPAERSLKESRPVTLRAILRCLRSQSTAV